MIIPLIIEALEDIGPCDVETLSGHMGQSESMINSLLVNYMRKGMVRCINPSAAQCIPREYELTEKARIEYGTDKPAAGRSGSDVSPAPVESVVPPVLEPVTSPASSQPLSKVEQLRRIMQDDCGEMYVSELADESNIPAKSIPGLLQNDVRLGQVSLRKVDGKSVYRWVIGAAKPAISVSAHQQEACASKGIEAISGVAARQHNNVAVSDEKPSVSESPSAPATITIPVMVENITVPTSAVLMKDLYDLDTELVSLTERLKALQEDRERKTQMLLAVQKLEELMKGDKQ